MSPGATGMFHVLHKWGAAQKPYESRSDRWGAGAFTVWARKKCDGESVHVASPHAAACSKQLQMSARDAFVTVAP
eukprot:1158843-Pelagomonas_calceolata.AAC.17